MMYSKILSNPHSCISLTECLLKDKKANQIRMIYHFYNVSVPGQVNKGEIVACTLNKQNLCQSCSRLEYRI